MRRINVSIIDDDSIYQYITGKILRTHPNVNNVLQFLDGQEGILYIKSHLNSKDLLPDLIFLDINMPYLNGWQFMEELTAISEEGYRPAIYMVSSSDNLIDLKRAENYGLLKGYKVKPFTKIEIDSILQDEYQITN